VTHVIARTAGSKRKYYHRRQEHGGWTPWEEIKLGIEDNPVVLVRWNDRLLLMWVQIIKQAPSVDTSSDDSDSPPEMPRLPTPDELLHWSKADWAGWRAAFVRYVAYERSHQDQPEPKKLTDADVSDLHSSVKSEAGEPLVSVLAALSWSEYYDGKWLPANTSDVNTPTLLGTLAPHGPKAFDRSRLRLRTAVLPDGPLMVHLALDSELDAPGAGFLLYNTHTLPIELGGLPAEILHAGANQRFASYASSALRIDYKGAAIFSKDILHPQIAGQVIEPQPGLPSAWEAPFIYEDSRNVFYVTSEELHQPHTTLRSFGFAHPSGVGHGGTPHHFSPIVAPHQSGRAHGNASTTSTVRYDGVLIGAAGRVTAVSSHAGVRR
jgi:hypothetical protein